MGLHNIKDGFRRCGVFLFNPKKMQWIRHTSGAVDKTHLSTAVDKTHFRWNQLISGDDNDLSIPPPQPYTKAGTQTEPLPEYTQAPDNTTLRDTTPSGTCNPS